MRAERWLAGLAVITGLALSSAAHARVYPTPILITNEDDLRNLYEDGLLEDDDLQVLIELLNNPLNINSATRGELYDLPGVTFAMAGNIVQFRQDGFFETPNDLLQVEGFNETILDQVLPFVYTGSEIRSNTAVNGQLTVRSAWFADTVPEVDDDHPNRTHTPEQLGYGRKPATMATLTMRYGSEVEVGLAGLYQEHIRGLSYNDESHDFSANYGMVAELGRAYVSYDNGRHSAIVGSYSAGFGQGLVFDRTGRTNPNSFYKDLSITASQDFDRFRLPKRMWGGSYSATVARFGYWNLDATVFVSSARYDLYQYDMGVLAGRDWDDYSDSGSSPRVYIDGQKAGWMTLPNAYRESLIGGNLALSSSTVHLGLTSYVGALQTNTIDGVTDSGEFAIRGAYPTSPRYGAVGADYGLTFRGVDLLGEAAFTFSGGAGFLQRLLFYPRGGEVEVSLRRYGLNYDNPHARGLSAADEFEGMRDRGEQGARVKGTYAITDWLSVRGSADVWQDLRVDTGTVVNGHVFGRISAQPIKLIRIDVYGNVVDRNLAERGRNQIYEGDISELYSSDSREDPDSLVLAGSDRSGMRAYYGTQLVLQPVDSIQLSALYQRMYEDAGLLYPKSVLGQTGPECDYYYQVGQYAWFRAAFKPTDGSRISARIRYRDEDVHGNKDERWADGFIQVEQRFGKISVAARGNLGFDLPDPDSEYTSYCDTLASPDLEGTCAVDPTLADAGERAPYGYVWLMVKARF